MFLSERVEEEEENLLPSDQLLDHSDDDDESDSSKDMNIIEELKDEDIQQIHIGGPTASVQVRRCSLLCINHTFTHCSPVCLYCWRIPTNLFN